MKALRKVLCLLVLATFAGTVKASAEASSSFVPTAEDVDTIAGAISDERPTFDVPKGVTGISVPHHLLAADLIARGFWAASAGDYDRIVLISPDHFDALPHGFGIATTDIDTIFGTIPNDQAVVQSLLGASEVFVPLADVSREHGLHSVAPFIRRFFPEAAIVPILASVNSRPEEWRAVVALLAPVIDDRTLVIQSTDYSHYRPLAEAVIRDQETLGIIAAEESDAIAALLQPSHLDSKAAQFVQMEIQHGLGARPVVLANRNSVEYATGPDVTTSYIVTAWHRDPAAAAYRYADQDVVYLAGDTLPGRFLTPALTDDAARGAIVGAVRGITRGAPLIVNLEGVLVDEPVTGAPPTAHIMRPDVALPILHELDVAAAGLANNHSYDLGALGIVETQRILEDTGIATVGHGEVIDLGSFRLLALNAVQSIAWLGPDHFTDSAEIACTVEAAPPLVALVHWGSEYTATADPEVEAFAHGLRDCGATLVAGAHSHQASDAVDMLAGGATQWVYSLGNFLFDQSAANTSGALLEARIFRQGTIAARLIPIPNLFTLGSGRADAHRVGVK